MDVAKLKVSQRSIVGKKVKTLRRQGLTPVHMYGSGTGTLALQAETLILNRVVPRVGMNIPLSVEVEGNAVENICFVREVQRHPVTEDILHVDFLRVDVTEAISADVPIVLEGEAPAVTDYHGTLFQSLQSISVEGLPMDIPPAIHVDISILDDFEKSILVGDVVVPSNITVLSDLEELLVRVNAPRAEEPEEVEEEAEEGAEAEEEGDEEEEEE